MAKEHKPGEKVPESGQYKVVGPRGGDKGREVTSTQGERFPPGEAPGERYRIADRTKHRGKGK